MSAGRVDVEAIATVADLQQARTIYEARAAAEAPASLPAVH